MTTYTAFLGTRMLAKGDLETVLTDIKRKAGEQQRHDVLIFSDTNGRTFDIDLSGDTGDVLHRARAFLPAAAAPAPKGPGRPRLGVTAREVSLLPRHWEWLETQAGGASSTLRKLVEQASKATQGRDAMRQAQERTYHFLNVLAGDLPGYEEALRALYRDEGAAFEHLVAAWPKDVRNHALRLRQPD